jgi:hypothetical protein
MQIDLSADEVAVLADVVDSALGDLREQVYKAEVTDYKDSLKQREVVLTRIQAQLGASRTTG